MHIHGERERYNNPSMNVHFLFSLQCLSFRYTVLNSSEPLGQVGGGKDCASSHLELKLQCNPRVKSDKPLIANTSDSNLSYTDVYFARYYIGTQIYIQDISLEYQATRSALLWLHDVYENKVAEICYSLSRFTMSDHWFYFQSLLRVSS